MCHALERRTNDPDSASVAETVQHFITAMDSLRINLVAVDQVCCMFTAQFSTFVACCTWLLTITSLPACLLYGQQICPILQDLITAMSKVQSLPADFAPKVGQCEHEVLASSTVLYVLLARC